MTYSLAMKEGEAESRDLQVLLVGAENTGKTCLISSFLGVEFVEGQSATEGAELEVCKIYSKIGAELVTLQTQTSSVISLFINSEVVF